jgi:predicted ribonuclease YlaK
MKYILPDTNIIINEPSTIKKLVEKNIYVVIPVTVLNELDNFKIKKELGFRVREAGRIIEDILAQRSKYLILTNYHKETPGLIMKKADDRILSTALYFKDQGKTVFLLSNDRFLRLKAEGLGIRATTPQQQLYLKHPTVQETKEERVAQDHQSNIDIIETISSKNRPYLIITTPIHIFQNYKLRFSVEGFNKKYLSRVKAIKPGDRFVYYVAGDKEFVAITEITSAVHLDMSDYWPMEQEAALHHCLKMIPKIIMETGQALSARKIVLKLSFIRNKANWGAYFQGSIKNIPRDDYLIIEKEMLAALGKRT